VKSFLAIFLAAAIIAAVPASAGKRKKGKGKGKGKLDTEVVLEDRIEIRIHGLNSGKGWVICRLYDKKGWLKKATETVSGQIERRATVCVFTNIRPGTYAVAAFHDANKNGEVETDGRGGPGEGVCATNNITKIKDKPPFKKARFTYAGGVLTKATRMRYR